MRVRLGLGLLVLALCSSVSAEEGYGPLIANGLDEELAIGADLFFSETFEGNGRTCATCHAAADNYTLPADLRNVSETDPLMVGDPDNPAHVMNLELCDSGNSSEDCQAIRQNGLILVNADGDQFGPDGERSYSMRSIPHVLSLATSITAPPGGPANHTGWSGDGSPDPGSLQSFASGAVAQHFTRHTDRMAGTDFRNPSDSELAAMAAFQLELGRKNTAGLGFSFKDLNAFAGRTRFTNLCGTCHAGAGANVGGINRNFDTHIEEERMLGCPAPSNPGKCAQDSALLVPGANFDGGFGPADLSPADGRWGDGTFNTPPVIEAADTGPFFHDNRVDTLESAIVFYRSPTFLASPPCVNNGNCGLQGLPLGGVERELSAVLRNINAGFNISMAAQRLHAAFELLSTEPGTDPSVVKVLSLARAELEDAREVLEDVKFVGTSVFANNGNHIAHARSELDDTLASLNGQIANGTSGVQLAVLLANLISLTEDHLADELYDESEDACAPEVTVPLGQYHDCRWAYDLGEANVLFDNNGVVPEVVGSQTRLTWTPNPGGTATLTLKWRTAEWTNPLFDKTVLSDISPNPSFTPITFTGAATQLASGEFERSYSRTIPCVPNAKYRMDITARVGGVTETDYATAKAKRFCIGP